MNDDDELDPVHLSAQLERLSNILETICVSLEEQDHLDLLPDNAYDWWESLKENRKEAAQRMQEKRKELIARAKSKLSPEEWEALRG